MSSLIQPVLAFVTHTRSTKHITRRSVLARRDAMTVAERMAASTLIADRTIAMVLAHAPVGGIVAAYAAKGSEVDTAQIDEALRAAGRRVAYPRIADGGRQLAFHEVTIDELAPGKFLIREPLVTATDVPLASIAAFVVPCVAFSRDSSSMTRIGWGGGHYDSTLVAASASALRIGLAFECQRVDGVPAEAHDVPLHHVVTETGVYPEHQG